MIQARFTYHSPTGETRIVGRWVDVTSQTELLPNKQLIDDIICVQFRDTDDLTARAPRNSVT